MLLSSLCAVLASSCLIIVYLCFCIVYLLLSSALIQTLFSSMLTVLSQHLSSSLSQHQSVWFPAYLATSHYHNRLLCSTFIVSSYGLHDICILRHMSLLTHPACCLLMMCSFTWVCLADNLLLGLGYVSHAIMSLWCVTFCFCDPNLLQISMVVFRSHV